MSVYHNIKISDEVMHAYDDMHLSCRVTDVTINTNYALDEFLHHLSTKLNLGIESLKDHPTVRALRDFYWRIGIDPTKTRPSSEALARRFIASKRIPKINNVVDAGNIASIETLVPIGIYDANKIVGDVTLRLAYNKEEFTDISGEKHVLHGREIVLSDSTDIIHVFPYRDAFRTRVNEDTKRVLIIGCGVPGIDKGLTKIAVDRTLELINILGPKLDPSTEV